MVSFWQQSGGIPLSEHLLTFSLLDWLSLIFALDSSPNHFGLQTSCHVVPCSVIVTSVPYFKVFNSNNSSASTAKSGQRDVPSPSSTSDQLFKKSVFSILIILVLFYRTCLLVIVTIILLRVLLQNPNFMDQFFMCLFCLDICRPLSTPLYSCGE